MGPKPVGTRRRRFSALLVMAAALSFGLAGTASATPTGESAERAGVQASRIVTMVQRDSVRFLDAHEIQSLDFNVVTRPFQNNNTQRWILTDMGGGLFTIQQLSTGRFLDAHEIADLDFRVVTRPRQDNNTQLWRLRDVGSSFFTVQQVSSGRFLDAHQIASLDFQVVTRPPQNNDSQLWQIINV
jgi:hypothetical protein